MFDIIDAIIFLISSWHFLMKQTLLLIFTTVTMRKLTRWKNSCYDTIILILAKSRKDNGKKFIFVELKSIVTRFLHRTSRLNL